MRSVHRSVKEFVQIRLFGDDTFTAENDRQLPFLVRTASTHDGEWVYLRGDAIKVNGELGLTNREVRVNTLDLVEVYDQVELVEQLKENWKGVS